MTKELRFQKGFRHRSTVNCQELVRTEQRIAMDCFGYKFFTCALFPYYKYWYVALGKLPDHFGNFHNLRCFADHFSNSI